MIKLFLTLLSLLIIYKGVMDTGDPKGFYSSTAVFYAMLLLDYYTHAHRFKTIFIYVARAIIMILAGISAMGVLGILTVSEIDKKFYIAFDNSMRLGNDGLINLHWLFLFLAFVSVVMSALELIFSIDVEKDGNDVKKVDKKGA
jgi:hypothetical protein